MTTMLLLETEVKMSNHINKNIHILLTYGHNVKRTEENVIYNSM